MSSEWLIIGISGVTCGGKTTLTKEILELLPGTDVLSQDDYFYPEDSDKHTLIPELNHFNWEIMSSLDMEKMYADIQKLINNKLINIDVDTILQDFYEEKNKEPTNKDQTIICKNVIHLIKNQLVKHNIKILLLEGFSIFNYEPIDAICHLKFYLTLSRETCHSRRSNRTYIPADVPGYFDKCVWPEHMRQYEEVKQKSRNVMFFSEEVKKKTPLVFDNLAFILKKIP